MKIRWSIRMVYLSAILICQRSGCEEVHQPNSSNVNSKFIQQTASSSFVEIDQKMDHVSLDVSNYHPTKDLPSVPSGDYSPSRDVSLKLLNQIPVTPLATVLKSDVLSSRTFHNDIEATNIVQSSLLETMSSYSVISYEPSDQYDADSSAVDSEYLYETGPNSYSEPPIVHSSVNLQPQTKDLYLIEQVSASVSPTIVVRSVEMIDETKESSVPIAEDRFGVIEDEVDNSAESLSRISQLRTLGFSTAFRDQVDGLRKETRQNKPSIEHIISGLVNLLGGDVKTSQRRPNLQHLPRPPPYRRPPRLPVQPKPSLVKIPSFPSSSRINHRGPPKFNGIRPGVNIGVPTNPNYAPHRPSSTVPVYLNTKQKPNRWEWPHFSDRSTHTSTSEIQSTTSENIKPSSAKSDKIEQSSTPESTIQETNENSGSEAGPSTFKSITEVTVSFAPTFSTLTKTPAIILTSKPTTSSSEIPKSHSTLSSTINSPTITMEIQKALGTLNISPTSVSKETSVAEPTTSAPPITSTNTVLSSTEFSKGPEIIQPSFSSEISQDSAIATKNINPNVAKSTETQPQVAQTNPIQSSPSSVTVWKPLSGLKRNISSIKVPSQSSEIMIITVPSVTDITVTNKMSGATTLLKPTAPTSSRIYPENISVKPSPELIPTKISTSLPTPSLTSTKSSKKPSFNLNERPRPATTKTNGFITLSGEGSFKPGHPANEGAILPRRPSSKIRPANNKPTLSKKPSPSRPSSIGRPTVIPVEIDQYRNKPNVNRNFFQNRRPGSGNTQVVGAGIQFEGSSSEVARPVRPLRPVSRPRPSSNYKPNLPPIRIDTCVVGEDSTCDHKLNEQCRTEHGVSSCVCRPGFARTGSRGPCFSVVSLAASIRIDRYGPRKISFNRKLLDESTDQYKILKEESQKAVNSVFRYSKYRGLFYGSKINKFYPIGRKVIVNVTFTLERNPDTLSDAIRPKLQNELIRVIASRKQNIGDSVLYVDLPINPVLGVQDLNECSSSLYNDCGKNSECENIFGSFKCRCRPGYIDKYPKDQLRTGRHCSTCPSSFCNNHGDCVAKNGKQECMCKGSYIGDKCDIDGEVLGVALGVSLAAVLIIILTLICLCNWSRRWRQEEQKMDRASGRTSGSSGNTFTYIDKPGNNGGPNPYMDDRLRWPSQLPDAINNYYGSEPVNGQPMGNPYGGLFPTLTNGSRPITPKSPKHLENQYHVPRPRSRAASLTGSGLFYDADFSRDIYNSPGRRGSGYAIPLRPMRS